MNVSQDNLAGNYRTGSLSKSPLRTAQNTWANVSNMNKSAIVDGGQRAIPDKLQQMKDRVRRDRSANTVQQTQNDENAEKSLYGRKKQAQDINLTTQKLRESYNNRKQNRSTSNNGGAGTSFLQKQNFKEKAYENPNDTFARSRGSASFDNRAGKENMITLNEQQNTIQLKQQNETTNRFKRTQQKSNLTLASYQQKLERLGANYKKFTTNLINPNQSEQVIEEMKYKTGLSFINKIIKRANDQDYRRAFKLWKLNSGVAMKQYENQEKTMLMTKVAAKMQQKSLNHVKIQFYQKWKNIVLQGSGGSGSNNEKMLSKFSEMVTSTEEFNKCIENDFHLSVLLNDKLQQVIQVAASDLVFFQNDELNKLKAYHHSTGEQLNFNLETISNSSVLGQLLLRKDQDLSLTQNLQKDPNFCQEVDMPINQESIIQLNQQETNAFNKIRNLSMVLIKMQYPLRIGVLRLYFNAGVQGNGPTKYQMQQVQQLQRALPMFLQRIFDVRSQINSLALNNIDQQAHIRELEFFNQINQSLRKLHQEILNKCEHDHSSEDIIDIAKGEVEDILRMNFDMENVHLKQIYQSKTNVKGSSLMKNDNRDLIKQRHHVQEDSEVLEDYLDHKKEYYVHQISVCPKLQIDQNSGQKYDEFTYVLHIINKYKEDPSAFSPMLADVSTSLTLTAISATHKRIGMMNEQRNHLDEALKHKLAFYFRNLTPILNQALSVAQDLAPKIANLEVAVAQSETRYNLQQFLHKCISEQNLIEDQDEVAFYFKLRGAVLQASKFFGVLREEEFAQGEDSFFLLLNKSIFHTRNNTSNIKEENNGQFQFSSYLTDDHLQLFDQFIVKRSNLEGSRKRGIQNFEVYESESDFKEVGCTPNILPMELTIQTENDEFMVLIPLINPYQFHTIAILAFTVQDEKKVDIFNNFAKELSIFCLDFIEKRQGYHQLQEKHDKLLMKLQGEKMSQETKDMIDEHLILPFIKKQTLKSLGEGIDYLSDRMVTNQGEQLDLMGQEVSQIAFMSPNVFIEDVRLLNTYSQSQDGEGQRTPEKMMVQSYQQKQQIIYEDELLDKVVILFPLMNANAYRSAIYQQSALILRFVLDRDIQVQKKLENIHSQLINCIQPIVNAALVSDVVSVKQTLALSKLCSVIDKYRFANYREMVYFMRDLKAKNVYNFSRSRLFDKIAKSKRVQDLQGEYFDFDQKQLDQNQKIQSMIRDALKVMNVHAFKYKQSCFKKFIIGTRTPLYDMNISKKKKRGICAIFQYAQLVQLRMQFSRYAVNAKLFKCLRHPKTKYLASVHCLFRNFRLIRERLAFLKMKKNLNLQLRDSMKNYKEHDKDLFIQLNQILVSSHQQQGGIEGGFSYALSEIFQYLQNMMKKENHIKDVGGVADDNFVGHCDEVIFTLKSGAYLNLAQAVQPGSSQKLKIYMCQFREAPSLSASQNLNKTKSMLISYDQNLDMSQQDQMLNQIQNNIEMENNDIVPQNEFENQLSSTYQKYIISQKRDLIHQMLTKSNGIIFNFQNIQQSLSDIYLGQQSQHKDQNIGNRFAVVRRSKSALIIPLFDVSQQTIIGSFELYKYHQQAFTEEIEARYDFFSKLVSDFFLLYAQLAQQTMQIGQLRWQMQKAIRPVQSLSQLLKNVYVNGPGIHFPGASHVLPIVILNKSTRISNNDSQENIDHDNSIESKIIYEVQKLAFFYQFKDNHIYNFDYDGTFIDELMENGCILEMCKKGAMSQDEQMRSQMGFPSGRDSNQSSIENLGDLASSRMGDNEGVIYTNRQGTDGQRYRTLHSQNEKVKSVMNDFFKHIVYYPVFDVQDESKIIAILEVGYKKKDTNAEVVITDEIQQYLDQFRSLLGQFKVRLNSFSRNLENLCVKRQEKRQCQMFQQWKQMMIFAQYKEQFQHNQFQALQSQESCYGEYMHNLNNYGQQLKTVTEDKKKLQQQILQFQIEKKAKLKFLATSLLSAQNLFKKLQLHRSQKAFLKWQYNASIRKIAETAFSRVLELNHRHSKARFKTAVFMLQSIAEDNAVKCGFKSILESAHMRRFGQNWVSPNRYGINGSRSRGRTSIQPEASYMLNNVSSLLSPSNMKKIEKKNLYNQQINSFYAPQGDDSVNQNNSAIINAKSQFSQSQHPEEGGLPFIQLKPHEITKQARAQQRIDRGDQRSASRYSMQQTNAVSNGYTSATATRNPYNDLNASQIEYTQGKRDYSPIITTSKYDMKKIYDPQSGNQNVSKSYRTQQNSRNGGSRSRQKRARSVENSHKQPLRKAQAEKPLLKQLQLKEMQLNMMKTHMDKTKTKKQTSNRNISEKRYSFGNREANYHSTNQMIQDHRASTDMQHRLSNKFQTKRSSSRIEKNKTPTIQQQIAMFSVESDSLGSIAHGTLTQKYADINGKDASPPVREKRKRSQEKVNQKLKQRYSEISQESR